MKKLLNISVIAALAILPMAANAAVTDADPGATDASAPVATNAPKYGLAQAGAKDGNLATAGYVKGAYNAAIKAVNKVATTVASAANQDLSNLSATGKSNVSAQGTVDLTKNDYGTNTIGKALVDIKTTADAALTSSSTLNGANLTNGSVAKTALAQGVQDSLDLADSALQAADLADYATQDGVENTIETATINATVPTLTVWDDDTSYSTVAVDVSSITATYAEPAGGGA